MSTNIKETIDRLRELDRYASPAPWKVGETESGGHAILCEYVASVEVVIDTLWEGEPMDDSSPDLEIITETRNALPALLAEIDRLTAENKNLTAAWEGGYKAAAHTYYEGFSEPDDFAQEARVHSPYQENKK